MSFECSGEWFTAFRKVYHVIILYIFFRQSEIKELSDSFLPGSLGEKKQLILFIQTVRMKRIARFFFARQSGEKESFISFILDNLEEKNHSIFSHSAIWRKRIVRFFSSRQSGRKESDDSFCFDYFFHIPMEKVLLFYFLNLIFSINKSFVVTISVFV
jgi:hypothetical protein